MCIRDSIYTFTERSVTDELAFVEGLRLTEQQMLIADRILKEIRARLGFLQSVGLSYLTLARSAATLSGGESQRIRLATQIGSSLLSLIHISPRRSRMASTKVNITFWWKG